MLNQTYQEFEFIIVNDGSTDQTREIIESFTDDRIKLINLEKNVGIPTALNIGLELCQGKYIIKIDGDDIQYLDRFQKQLDFMENNPEYAMSKCLIEYFSTDEVVSNSLRFKHRVNYDQKIKNSNKTFDQTYESLMLHCSVSHTTMMINRDILQKMKYNDYRIFEDYDLFYRLVRTGFKIGHLDEILVKVRVSDDSTTGKTNSSIYNEIACNIKLDILEDFKKNPTIYIWGTGSYAKDVTDLLTDKGWKIEGYIDSFCKEDGLIFEGKNVFSPSILNERNIKVVIAASTGLYEIAAMLKSRGYKVVEDFISLR